MTKRRFVGISTVAVGGPPFAYIAWLTWNSVPVWFIVFEAIVSTCGGLAWGFLMWRFFVLPYRARTKSLGVATVNRSDDA